MPQHDAFFDTLEMDLQLQQRVQDEQLEEELLERVGAFRAAECACARHGGEFWREARQPTSYMRAHVPDDEFSWLEKSRTRRVRPWRWRRRAWLTSLLTSASSRLAWARASRTGFRQAALCSGVR